MRATSERYRDGSQTLLQLRNRCWGLYETAELRDKDDRDRFLDTYYVPNSADARDAWLRSWRTVPRCMSG